ncbi:MAG: Stp1/IreP family PP2C-type Ser/Thr phosphatase [Acidimicrobiia bacterium]
MIYTWSSATHPGLVRSHNQDAVYPAESGQGAGPLLVAVADGMGGHVAGDVASRVAIETAASADGGPKRRVAAANRAVLETSRQHPELAGMGTTLTLAALQPDGALRLAHVGDSRAYILRDGDLRQLTTDHSLVAEYLAAGRIDPEEVATHPQRSVITRALGIETALKVDLIEERLRPGDRVLLCSDGLNSMLDDEEIMRLLGAATPAEDITWALVEAANRAGGEDNVSVVVVDVS